MATHTISEVIAIGDRISGDHEEYRLLGLPYGYRIKIASDSTDETKRAISTFEVKLAVCKHDVMTSLRIAPNTNTYIAGEKASVDASSFSLIYNNITFMLDNEGNLLDNRLVDLLNEYKTQNGEYPSLLLRLETVLERPPTASDGTQTTSEAYYYKSGSCVYVNTIVEGELVTLRPVSDVSRTLGASNFYPNENEEEAYLLVNEEIADDEATYIYANSRASDSTSISRTGTYVFGLDASILPQRVNLIAIKAYIRCQLNERDASAVIGCSVIINNQTFNIGEISGDTVGYETLSTNSLVLDEKIVEEPLLQYAINIDPGTHSSGYKGNGESQILITQTYLELIYIPITDIGIHKKVGGVVKAATAAYRKLGGSWVEVTEEEAKDVLKNNIITEGKT